MIGALFGRDLFTSEWHIVDDDITNPGNSQYPQCEITNFEIFGDYECSSNDGAKYGNGGDMMWDWTILPLNEAI